MSNGNSLQGKQIELVLSIFLAVCLAQGLVLFLTIPDDLSWFGISFIFSLLILFAIYWIMKFDIKQNKLLEYSRASFILLISLLPFLLQRSVNESETWNLWYTIGYILAILISMIFWGYGESKIDKQRGEKMIVIAVAILIVLALILLLTRPGGWFK
jgi:uncharacterized membrane protein